MSLEDRQHIVDCVDAWLKVGCMPTYSEVLATLEDLTQRCDGTEGVRADGSNIQTYQANAVLARARDTNGSK